MKTDFYEKRWFLHDKLDCVRLSFLLFMLLSSIPMLAQNMMVKGVVVDF